MLRSLSSGRRRLVAISIIMPLILVLALAATGIAGCAGGDDTTVGPSDGNGQGDGNDPAGVKIAWFGHSCFLITSPEGVEVLTDPYPGNLGYGNRRFSADIVTVSHEHFDHNSVASVENDPVVLRGLSGDTWATAEKTVGDTTVYSVGGTYHDADQGSQRGKNSLFVIETGGLRLLHLGDLGHVPPADLIERIGPVDVLFIPVGGYFTIDGPTASEVADLFGAKIVIPMHYKTAAISDWQVTDEKPFLADRDNVKTLGTYEAEVLASDLPETPETWVFDYAPEGTP